MAQFPRIQEALAGMDPNSNFGAGEHSRRSPSAGDIGQVLGFVSFDPNVHDTEHIDHLAFVDDGSAESEYFVQQVLPEKPFNMTNIQDVTSRYGANVLADPKAEVIADIVQALVKSLTGQTDHAYLEIANGSNRQEFVDKTADSIDHGLTFGVSDFHGLDFGDVSLDGLVAIKVNHLLEREIPANVGFISLGGYVELNTNDSRDLSRFNESLEEKHQETAERLEALGAFVISVVADPRVENGFDVARADTDIAKALKAMSR